MRAEGLQAKLIMLDQSLDGTDQQEFATKDALKRRLAAARTFFAAVSDAGGLDDVEDLADALLLAINEAAGQWVPSEDLAGPERAARREEEPRITTTSLAGLAFLASARKLARLEPLRAGAAPAIERWWPTLLAAGAILVAIAFVMTVAAGSVAATSYATTVTFGTTADYVKLFFVALGSSAVTGVISIILLWHPKSTQ